MKLSSEFNLEWIHLGPVMNSARVEAVQGVPGPPGIIYVAFGSGNLWKTTDNGLTWKAIFENQPVLGIGDIAVAPSDPDVIWLGSGESLKKARNFTMPGAGVFKSDDGGDTWAHKGLDDSFHIGEIAVDPVGYPQDYLRRTRQLGSQISEHLCKRRYDVLQHSERGADGDDRHYDRIYHGTFDLAGERIRFFPVICQTNENRVESTANLTGLYHVHIELIKDLLVLSEGL